MPIMPHFIVIQKLERKKNDIANVQSRRNGEKQTKRESFLAPKFANQHQMLENN